MLSLSKKGGYGVEVLIALSSLKEGERLSIKQISENEKLPQFFLSQIMSSLKQSNLVISKEGSGGGYCLSKAPKDISLLEIIGVFEGDSLLVDCACRSHQSCYRHSCCSSRKGWKLINKELRDFFNSKTLQDLIVLK